ncbi:hypothetical protein M4951_22720 [Blastopirellula sp. J2-11]|uniref:hypothetical protein n=1 Tax=Blastopirellula sp. J2-11 TaxID=2943192 RepID=UPI0021C6DA3A|nr:hypothetical protein [Blastopirellula sp. J2-11]UUO06159.1 hypothetical protein M4951_22720 [Blastopirellula sp. J2-11]
MWALVTDDDFDRKWKKWPKKYSREMNAMLDHLRIVHEALECGAAVEQLQFGFIHREPSGVLALDEKGGGSGLKATRLYVFPDKDTKTLHVITVGDKNTQGADIKYCKGYVAGLRSDRTE